MHNHYHLPIESPEGNLYQGMRQFNGSYTQHFNKKYQRVGHLFQGRFKSILIYKYSYLLQLSRSNPEKTVLCHQAIFKKIFQEEDQRKKKIYQSYQGYGYTLYLGLHYTTIN